MKVKIFNKENVPSVRSSLPAINLNYKSGLISLNNTLSTLMGIKKGDGIEFAQDEEDPESWYIFKSKGDQTFVLRQDKDRFSTNNSSIVRSILDSVHLNISCSPKVSTEPEKVNKIDMYAILLSSVITDDPDPAVIKKKDTKESGEFFNPRKDQSFKL